MGSNSESDFYGRYFEQAESVERGKNPKAKNLPLIQLFIVSPFAKRTFDMHMASLPGSGEFKLRRG